MLLLLLEGGDNIMMNFFNVLELVEPKEEPTTITEVEKIEPDTPEPKNEEPITEEPITKEITEKESEVIENDCEPDSNISK